MFSNEKEKEDEERERDRQREGGINGNAIGKIWEILGKRKTVIRIYCTNKTLFNKRK